LAATEDPSSIPTAHVLYKIFSEKSVFDALVFFFMHAVKEGEYAAVLPLQRLWRAYVMIIMPQP